MAQYKPNSLSLPAQLSNHDQALLLTLRFGVKNKKKCLT